MMNEHLFLLINYRNHEEKGEEPPESGFLKVPPGYRLEKMALGGDSSIARGHNAAMRQSAARYKIYLQEGSRIIHQDILSDLLALFEKYPGLGLVGVMGAKRLPANGIWWEARETYGKMNYQGRLIEGSQAITGDFESVQAVDGMMMATRYDLPWREDIFQDRFFYDVAQSLEFVKAGYTVGVARQTEPWVAMDRKDDLVLFQYYRRLFVREYGGIFGGRI